LKYLRPGELLEPSVSSQPIQPPTENELSTLKKNLVCEFENLSETNFNVDHLINEIENRIEQIKDINFGQCPKLLFDWKQQCLEIDLTQGRVNLIDDTDFELPLSYMKVTASKAYFHLMSDPTYRWQDIYLTLRASVQRAPDVFNTFVNIFLFSDTSNIRSGFLSTLAIKDDRILIVNPQSGKNYEINRYCPHNGADLRDAKIDNNGNLICPRHSWLFNLENDGKCEKADSSIDAREVIETSSLSETVSARLLKLGE
jgi:UDP-MurNAc hydroxylase